jgi:hypothetical protein
MLLIAGSLGVLIWIAWGIDLLWKASIREIRDIWHEKDEDDEEDGG